MRFMWVLLQRCVKRRALAMGKHHACDADSGCYAHMCVSFRSMSDAVQGKGRLREGNVQSWSTLISRCVNDGKLRESITSYSQMVDKGVKPDKYAFLSLLKACGSLADLRLARWMHKEVAKYKWDSDLFVGNSVVAMYAKCGSMADAQHMFDTLCHRNVVSWNALIAGYANQEQGKKALELYSQMQQEGVRASIRTFVSVLQACGSLAATQHGIGGDVKVVKGECLKLGTEIHNEVVRRHLPVDNYVGNTLVYMYANCGNLVEAVHVFETLSHRDAVSWTILMAIYAQQGQGEKALQLYARMQDEGVRPQSRTFVSALKACSNLAASEEAMKVNGKLVKAQCLKKGKSIHADFLRTGSEIDIYVGTTLVDMYAVCGSMVDAQKVFDSMPRHDVLSWTALIRGYAQQQQGGVIAVQLFADMLKEGVKPSSRTFLCVLKTLGSMASMDTASQLTGQSRKLECLQEGRQIHAKLVEVGLGVDVFLCNSLIDMYANCGSMEEAKHVFDAMPKHDVVSWTTMIGGYAQQGQGETALQFFAKMGEEGVQPNSRTFVSLLKACGSLAVFEQAALVDGLFVKLGSLRMLKAIHEQVITSGFESDIFVGTSLVGMYVNCGSMVDAVRMFDALPHRDVVSWTAMISGYGQQGQAETALQLLFRMKDSGVTPDRWTFMSVLKTWGSEATKEQAMPVDGQSVKVVCLSKGKLIHAEVLKRGYGLDTLVGSALVTMYVNCGSMSDARLVLESLPEHNVVSWNAMLAGYAQQEQGHNALTLFNQMLEADVRPDNWSFVSALRACSSLAATEQATLVKGQTLKLGCLRQGRWLHTEAVNRGFERDMFVGTALIDMYAKCGSMRDAQHVFDGLPHRDVVSWNALILGYAQQMDGTRGLELYAEMQAEGVRPDGWTFVSVLKACGSLSDMETATGRKLVKSESMQKVKEIHAEAIRRGLGSDIHVANTLIDTYAGCGNMADAEHVFNSLARRDVVSWNAMMTGYAQCDEGAKSMQIYLQMKKEGLKPNEATFLCALKACSMTGALESCSQIHQDVTESGLPWSSDLATTLVHAYGKCGDMVRARTVFNTAADQNTALWNSLITGYSAQGECQQCFQSLHDMKQAGLHPNGATFAPILAACSHAGLVEEGRNHFQSMTQDDGITPTIEHYGSMVDLFARAGLFDDAEALLSTMPMQPDLPMWSSLLAACRMFGNIPLARRAFQRAVTLAPSSSSPYILMSQIYAQADMREEADKVERLRQHAGAWKEPGTSWIENAGSMHVFVVDDRRHPDSGELRAVLCSLTNETLRIALQADE